MTQCGLLYIQRWSHSSLRSTRTLSSSSSSKCSKAAATNTSNNSLRTWLATLLGIGRTTKRVYLRLCFHCLESSVLTRSQLIAQTIYVPERLPACISPITARAPSRKLRIRWNWGTGLLFVFRKVATGLGRRHGRLSWRGRGCCNVVAMSASPGVLVLGRHPGVYSESWMCLEAHGVFRRAV